MSVVRVVTSYTNLDLEKRSSNEFLELGDALIGACGGRVTAYKNFPFYAGWLAKENPPWKAANPRATDRFVDDNEHIRSNIVQHVPVQMAEAAAENRPDVDVWVWLSYTILKQGDFRNNRVRPHHIEALLNRLEDWAPTDIPFPGITPAPVFNPTGDNWRFCGSTLILPKKWLPEIARAYRAQCWHFITTYGAVPLDLAIWPLVEAKSGLPFRFCQAEYDASQLTVLP
jgi:hypothetical protein